MRWLITATAVWLGLGLTSAVASPISANADCRRGQLFQISRDVEREEKGSDGSSGSSTDRDTLEERIVGSEQAGLEVIYDLPRGTSAEDRARQWQFPARVLRPPNGALQLLNQSQLTARADDWRKAAGLANNACGRWLFTWNAFQIECDPQSVLQTIEGFDLGPDNLAAGSLYRDRQALSPVFLKAKGEATGSRVLSAEMQVDPDAFRRDEARADVVVGEIMRKPVTLEAALRARSDEEITGTIKVRFDIDPSGHVKRQTKLMTVTIRKAGGTFKTKTVTQTLDRQLVGE